MIIYIDESYPDSQEKIILGALFVGQGDHKRLHSRINEIKRNQKFVGEIKYSEITDKTRFRIAKKMVDTFIESKNTFFCSCIIPYSATKLEHYAGIDTNQKRIKNIF